MAREKSGHTLQAIALIHEAYVHVVVDQQFKSRGHFFAAAAEANRPEAPLDRQTSPPNQLAQMIFARLSFANDNVPKFPAFNWIGRSEIVGDRASRCSKTL